MHFIHRYDPVPTLGTVPFVAGHVIVRQQMKKLRRRQRLEARQRLMQRLSRPFRSFASAKNEEVSSLSYETAV